MTNKITEARNTTIYTYDANGVIKTTLFNHVRESVSETTSPRGVMPIYFIDEVEKVMYHEIGTQDTCIDESEYDSLNEEEQAKYSPVTVACYDLGKWSGNGSKYVLIQSFDNQDDAENQLFEYYMNDFNNDDQRITSYYITEAESLEAYNESFPSDESEED